MTVGVYLNLDGNIVQGDETPAAQWFGVEQNVY